MSEVDFELMARQVRDTNQQIGKLRDEQREGFASLKAHDYAQHKDIQNLEQRVADLEDQIGRLNRVEGINAD